MDSTVGRNLWRLSVPITFFLAISLILANVLLSTHSVATNLRFYQALWVRYGVPEETGMTIEELSRAGDTLIAYLTGKAASPQVEATISGQKRPLFGADEITHLEDVRRLFQSGLTAEWLSIAAAFAGTMLLSAVRRRRAAGMAFTAAGVVSFLTIIALAIPAAADFGSWWTDFHLLTFTNDLWRLDPNTDWLIRMFPEEFFFSAVQRIGLHAAATASVFLVSGVMLARRPLRRRLPSS